MEWRTLFKQNVLNEGEDYIKSDSVRDFSITDDRITANVIGIENFRVDICISGDDVASMKCSCPYAKAGSYCKHMAAVLLAWENDKTKMEIDLEADFDNPEPKKY